MRTGEKEVSLGTLWKVLKSNFIWILACSVFVSLAAGLITHFFSPTRYSDVLNFYVYNISDKAEYMSASYINGASLIADTCINSAKRDTTILSAVTDETKEILDAQTDRACLSAIKRTISTTHENDSPFFTITVTHVNKEAVQVVTDTLERVYQNNFAWLVESTSGAENNVVDIREEQRMPGPTASKTSAVKVALIALVVSFVLAYAFFFLLDMLDTLVYDEKSLSANFSYPILGTIPMWLSSGEKRTHRTFLEHLFCRPRKVELMAERRLYDKKKLSPSTPFYVTEAFNLLRTNVAYAVGVGKAPVYGITSAVAGTGKSLILSNLALSFEQLGKRVLLVEADMRLPVFHKIFGTDFNRPGLSELLTGMEADDKNVIYKVEGTGLSVITSGHLPPNPTNLLAQPRMRELVAKWTQEYDIVFFDLPPIGIVADAGVLSDVISGYLIAVRSEVTDLRSVEDTISSLRSVDADIVGFVLNDVAIKKKGYGGYNKYGYYSHSAHAAEASAQK